MPRLGVLLTELSDDPSALEDGSPPEVSPTSLDEELDELLSELEESGTDELLSELDEDASVLDVLLDCGVELLDCCVELLDCGVELLDCGVELLDCGVELLDCGVELLD